MFERTLSEIMQEIKNNYSDEIMNVIATRDNSGKGFVCPVCGSGTGKDGTGLMIGTKNKHYFHCWNAGCGFKGDVFDYINVKYHCNDDPVEQIKQAEQILHRQFLEEKENKVSERKEKPKQAEQVNKNMVENTVKNNDNNNLLERARQEAEAKEQERRNITFIKASRDALATATDGMEYLKRRGISEQTAQAFGLGYCASYYFKHGEETKIFPAIIIPKYVRGKGFVSYTARNIENVEKAFKARKNKGEQGIFNLLALQNPGAVTFLCEGEFDALSIIEAGYSAICTGGETDREKLVEIIKERWNDPQNPRPEWYVILPDNDRNPDGTPKEEKGGYETGLKILDALKQGNVKATMIDTRVWNPDIKDANDYLVKDRNGFIALLRGIVEPIREKVLKDLGRASDYIQEFANHITGKTAPISTGFSRVNKLIDGGLHPGLIVIGAISSLGKTTFILNIADNMATKGQDVILFSLEMSKFELTAKSISRKTLEFCKDRKNGMAMKDARTNLGITDYDRYNDHYDADGNFIKGYSDKVKDMIARCIYSYENEICGNLYIKEGVGNIGVDEIRETVRKFIAVNHGRRPVIVIDYLQILAPSDPRSSDKQNTDKAVVELKRISRDFNIPVIAISSFNRDSYSEPVSMKAFKESGAIEYTSDILIGLQYHGMDYETYEEQDKSGKVTRKRETEKDPRRIKRIADLFADNEVKQKVGDPIEIDIKVLKNRSGARGQDIIQYYSMFNCYREE